MRKSGLTIMGFDASSVHTWRERGVHIWASFKTAHFFVGGNIKLLFGYIYFWNMIFQPILEVNIVVLLKILEIDIMLCFFVGNMIFSFTCFTQRLVVALVHRNLYLRRVNVVLIESIHRKITTSER